MWSAYPRRGDDCRVGSQPVVTRQAIHGSVGSEVMSVTAAPLATLGTLWVEFQRWDPKPRGFRRRARSADPWTLRFLDWTVDGVPLRDSLTFPNGRRCDDVTFMTEAYRGDRFVTESLRALLLENESGFDPWVQFTDGRAGLLFCPQCGDLACGAVSTDVRFTDSAVEWRDVAYQDGVTEEVRATEVPAFTLRFDREQYEATVRALLAEWGIPSVT